MITMSLVDLSIILPAHNEAEALRELLPELRVTLDAMAAAYEVILVDDGSRDETPAVARGIQARWPSLKILTHPRNLGQTPSLATGLAASVGTIVVTMDADGQNLPADIPKLYTRLRESVDLTMVSGRRTRRHDSPWRIIPSRIANALIGFISGTRITDTGCGLKAFAGDFIRGIKLGPDMHRFLPVILAMDGIAYDVVDVEHRPRHHGTPHYGLERTFAVVLDIIALRFTSRKIRPYHALGYVGSFGVVISFLLSLYILYEKYELGIWVHRNPLLLVAIVIFLSGVQIIILGLVCEILAVYLLRLSDSRLGR